MTPSSPFPAEADDFLQGGGELGALIRRHDWSATSLGPARDWPRSLKTAVRIVLTSRQPMFVWWGPDLVNIYNDAYRSIVGRRHPAALGRPAREVWREIWDAIGPRVASVLDDDEGTYDEALRLVMERNGYPEETYYTFSYSPIADDEGRPAGIFCANTDESRRVIGERQTKLLREMAARTLDARTIEDACRQSVDALLTNPADLAFALLYLPAESGDELFLRGRAGWDRPHPAAPDRLPLHADAPWPARRALERREQVVVDLDPAAPPFPRGASEVPPARAAVIPFAQGGQQGRAGVLVVGLNPYRLYDDDYRGFLDLVASQLTTSVNSARDYEEEREKAEALAEIDRAKTTFFSNVSHEFRTPLTLILGPIDELLDRAGQRQQVADQRQLALMRRNGQRLLKLVNTLLDFSRIEAGRMQARFAPTDLPQYTTDLASVFRATIEKTGLRLLIDCPPLGEPVYVDRDQWERIVLNLISNAFKFTFEGAIAVRLTREDGAAVLSVEDTGTGISAADQTRLFNRFYRVEGSRGRSFEGTGIGLAMVHELAKLHGGTVDVESTPGRGSRFRVRVPLGRAHLSPESVDEHARPVAAPARADVFLDEARQWGVSDDDADELPGEAALPSVETSRPADQAPPRLLLADDNADMREYLRRLLKPHYELTIARDGVEALEATRSGPFDLVLTDVMMPHLDGFGLLKAIRENAATASLPVVMLSARAGEEARVEGLQSGADDYLTKPFTARELLARIKSVLTLARVRREALLREQELKTETASVLESVADAFTAYDSEFRYIYVNAAAEAVIGMPREQVLGRKFWDVFPQVVGTELERIYRQVQAEQVPRKFEHHYLPWNRWFEIDVYPNREGGVTAYVRDVTEKRLADARLRASEAKYRQLVEQMPHMIWEADATGQPVFANRALREYMGAALETLTPEERLRLVHPDEAAASRAAWRAAVAAGTPYRFESRLRRHDGEYRWFHWHAEAVRDEAGVVTKWIGSAFEIHDRKIAEERLRESETRFRNMADHAPVMVWMTGPGGECHYLSRSWYEFTGQSEAEGLGDGWLEALHPDDRDESGRRFAEATRRGVPFRMEYRLRDALGEYHWAIDAAMPRLAPDGEFLGFIGSVIDISDRKRAEDALQQADLHKDEFLATLAHELRNPLAPIRSGLEVIKMSGDDPEVLGELREIMERQIDQMVRLVDDLLDVSRISRGKLELRKSRGLLSDVVLSAVETSRPLLDEAGHDFEVEIPASPVHLDADAARLAQVLSNLLNNAAKFTDPGGRVRLEAAVDGPTLTLSVADNGLGIAPEMRSRIFDMFTQADQTLEKTRGGLGIGLTIVKRLVEMHGGTVDVESPGLGRGSRFTVRLPVVASGHKVDGVAPRTRRVAGGGRVLVVDDNRDAARSLAMILTALGYETATADDGFAALDTGPEFLPEIVILDIGMPGMNGYDVCRAMRRESWGRQIGVVALTGWGQDEDRRRSEEAGFDAHLVKPVDLAELQTVLSRLAGQLSAG